MNANGTPKTSPSPPSAFQAGFEWHNPLSPIPNGGNTHLESNKLPLLPEVVESNEESSLGNGLWGMNKYVYN